MMRQLRLGKDGKKQSFRVFDDQVKFLMSWVGNPRKTGAVAPSSKALAAAMAAEIDPSLDGPVIELGPGTGPVTEALIARGISPDRIIALEFNPDFTELLTKRFPGITVVECDAYKLSKGLHDRLAEKAIAVVSSLPLFSEPSEKRSTLVAAAFELLKDGCPFIQFTYAPTSPLSKKSEPGLHATSSDWILKNVPPARVWTYRRIQREHA